MVNAPVVDGVNVGRPRCGDHNCHMSLASNRGHFCPAHDNLNYVCVIVGCDAPVTAGSQTCADASHRDIEHIHNERGQALFQLKERLKRAQLAHPTDDDSNPTTDEAFDDSRDELFNVYDNNVVVPNVDDGSSATLPAHGKRVRAQFGRKRTHNEQLIVASCGMILARETFYGAEAVGTVAVSGHLTVVGLC